jgi:hypothetical protein
MKRLALLLLLATWADAATLKSMTWADAANLAADNSRVHSVASVFSTRAQAPQGIPQWAWILIGAAVIAGVGAGAFFFIKSKSGDAEGKEAEDNMKQELIAVDVEAPKAAPTDYAALLSSLSSQISEDLGPKLAKGGAVRNVLEARAENFSEHAKTFLLDEMNGTAGAVLSEIEAEEAMLLLDWNNAVEANFPPMSILVAGVLSPSVLRCMASHHFFQTVTVGLPMFCLCVAAIYIDWGAVCTIPTIFAWLYTQTVLAFLMFLGHACLLVHIYSGIAQLNAKTATVSERMAREQDGSFSGMREKFIGNMVILQEGLLIENGIRHSFWNVVVGIATIAWVFTTGWNLTLIIGWTFVPGVVAFHPKAAEVAAGDFCGAWMTVIVLRVSTLLSVLYFFMNMATVIQFLCDMLIESKSFSNAVISQARKVDKGGAGLPIMETLVQAFLFRGGGETLNAKLAVVQHERAALEREEVRLQCELNTLEAKVNHIGNEEATLTDLCKAGGDLAAQCAKLSDESLDITAWKAKGQEAIQEAHAKASEVHEATTENLDKLWEKISENEAYNAVKNRAMTAYDTLNDPEFQAAIMERVQQASAAASQMANQAMEQAQKLADEAQKMASDPALWQQLNDQANTALKMAQEAAQKVQEAAGDPELQARLQKAAEEAFAQAQVKAQEVADQIQDPEMQAKLKQASMDAIGKVQGAANEAVEAANNAVNDPELQKKFQETMEKASDAAQSLVQDGGAA